MNMGFSTKEQKLSAKRGQSWWAGSLEICSGGGFKPLRKGLPGRGQAVRQESEFMKSFPERTLSLVLSPAGRLRAFLPGHGTGGKAHLTPHPASLKFRVLVPALLLSSYV